MAQFIDFIGNNVILFTALLVVLSMIIYTEYQRNFSGVKQLSVPDAIRLQNDENAIFVDVREANEFKEGHIIDAHSSPLSGLQKNLTQLAKYKTSPVVVYCATGSRSSRACSSLKKNQFESVYNLSGGIVAWQKANLPLVTK